MRRYIIKRVAHAVFVIWMVATAVFAGLRLIPGGPERAVFGVNAQPEAVEAFREEYGLNLPLHEQYINWMSDLLVGDLGSSMTQSREVTGLIMQTGPRTLSIAAVGIIIGLLISIPAGIVSATHRRTAADYVATVAAFLGISLPAFFIGILLVLLFGVYIDILPVYGYTPIRDGIVPWFKGIILPGIAVGTPYAAIVMRMMRGSLIDELNEPYMQTARAKGLSSRVRFYKHALQNAMIPVVTIAGIQVAIIITGSVTVELVFGINGLGRLLVDSMLQSDYATVQGTIILVATIMVTLNLIVDLTYAYLDPQIGYESDVA